MADDPYYVKGQPTLRLIASDPPVMWQPPDPPMVDGRCDRCGFRRQVYRGRHGGHRCAVCFGLQEGWMSCGSA